MAEAGPIVSVNLEFAARPPRRRITCHGVAAFLILCAAAFARLYKVESESLVYDEMAGLEYMSAPSFAEFLKLRVQHDHSPGIVFHAIEYCWTRLSGTSVPAMRMLSVLFGVCAVGAVYLLGNAMYGPAAGLIAEIIIAFSNLHIFFSQDLRMYPFVMLFSVISAYCLYRAVESSRWRWLGLHLAANLLVVQTHTLAAVLPIAQGCFMLTTLCTKRRLFVVWMSAHIAIALSLMLWIRLSGFGYIEQMNWIQIPTVQQFFRCISWDSTYMPRFLWRYLVFGLAMNAVLSAIIGALLCVAAAVAYIRKTPGTTRRLLFLGCWLIVPPAVLYAVSVLYHPAFVPRYLLYASPALYLMAGGAVSVLRKGAGQWTVAAVVLVFMLCHLFSEARPFRPDWNSCVNAAKAMTKPGDVVLLPRCATGQSLYYMQQNGLKVEEVDDTAALAARTATEHAAGRTVLALTTGPANDPPGMDLASRMKKAGIPFETYTFAGPQPTNSDRDLWLGWRVVSIGGNSLYTYRVPAER